jgi:hypothetical protein
MPKAFDVGEIDGAEGAFRRSNPKRDARWKIETRRRPVGEHLDGPIGEDPLDSARPEVGDVDAAIGIERDAVGNDAAARLRYPPPFIYWSPPARRRAEHQIWAISPSSRSTRDRHLCARYDGHSRLGPLSPRAAGDSFI